MMFKHQTNLSNESILKSILINSVMSLKYLVVNREEI